MATEAVDPGIANRLQGGKECNQTLGGATVTMAAGRTPSWGLVPVSTPQVFCLYHGTQERERWVWEYWPEAMGNITHCSTVQSGEFRAPLSTSCKPNLSTGILSSPAPQSALLPLDLFALKKTPKDYGSFFELGGILRARKGPWMDFLSTSKSSNLSTWT